MTDTRHGHRGEDEPRHPDPRDVEVTPAIAADMNTPGWSNQNAVRFPAATGAAAGIPGTFTPAGSARPANLAALTGIVAAPATLWTTGQYVDLTDWSKAYWNATAWVVGKAP